LFLVFGVYAGWVAGLAAVQLLIAATVHFGNGWSFSNVNGGWEYPVFLAFTALALALFDDGAWALKRSV
jgi:putative oxidoreductase